MFFSSSKKTEDDLFLIIDLGGGSVGGALVSISKDETPQIISSKRLNSNFTYLASDEKKTVSSIDKSLDEILTFLLKQAGHNKIKHVSCVLSSPWCQIRMRTLKLPGNEMIVLSKKYLDKLLSDEKSYFDKELDTAKNNLFPIESKILQTKINGYETINPYNKKGKDIEISSYFSFANKDFIKTIEDSFFRHFHIKKAGAYSFFLMYFNVLSRLYPENKNYAFADIREESTDISVVKDGMSNKTKTFPLGKNFMIRKIMESFNIPQEIVESYLRMYGENKIDPKISGKLNDIFANLKREWLPEFEKAISEVSGDEMPAKMFLISDESVKYIFPADSQKTQMIFVGKDVLKNFCKASDSEFDSSLAVESIFLSQTLFEQ